MSNIPHLAPSVNPSVEAKSPPVAPKPYFAGLRWANTDQTGLVVLPGKRSDKAPLVKNAKLFMGKNCRRPTPNEALYHRSLGVSYQDVETGEWASAQPILVLDSCLETKSLCVIDIDYAPKLQEVLKFLADNGIAGSILTVTTGREGGGFHLYFRREVKARWDYQSANSNTFFGSHEKDCQEGPCKKCAWTGKRKSNSVDFKATSSYVVCPGAVHKSGALYVARLDGEVVTDLDVAIDQTPVLPLSLWKKMRGPPGGQKPKGIGLTARDGSTIVDVGNEDPVWDDIISRANAGELRQVCPWCVARGEGDALRGKPNLEVWLGQKSAKCWNESGLIRRWGGNETLAMLNEALAIIDPLSAPVSAEVAEVAEVACILPPKKLKNGEPSLPLGGSIQEINNTPPQGGGEHSHLIDHQEVIDTAQFGYIDRVSDIHTTERTQDYKERITGAKDPFKHLIAGLIDTQEDLEEMEENTVILHSVLERPISHKCPNGMTLNAAWLHEKNGYEGSKRRMSCWSYKCPDCFVYLTASLASVLEAYMTRAISKGWNILPMVADWEGHNTMARKTAMLRWVSSAPEDSKEWLAIRTGVNEVRYLLFSAPSQPDVAPPTALVKAVGGTYSGQTLSLEEIRNTVDEIIGRLAAGREGIAATGCVMNLVLGTRRVCSTIKGLQNAITGKDRKSTGRAFGAKLLDQAVTKAEGLPPKKSEISEFISVPTRNHNGSNAAIEKHTGIKLTEKDPTAGGQYPRNTATKLRMAEVNLPEIYRVESQPGGLMERAKGGNRRGNKQPAGVEIGIHADGLTIVSVTEPAKELNDQLYDMGI